jgi:hypothetical protein
MSWGDRMVQSSRGVAGDREGAMIYQYATNTADQLIVNG